jgi:hypothetical protein
MKIVEFKKEKETTKPVILKTVENGEIIRFNHNTYEEALKEDLFYYVLSKKDKRVRLICLANAEEIERDEDWRVYKHDATISILK